MSEGPFLSLGDGCTCCAPVVRLFQGAPVLLKKGGINRCIPPLSASGSAPEALRVPPFRSVEQGGELVPSCWFSVHVSSLPGLFR